MIKCGKCGKDNQDHYKFCLGCGAELSKGSAPKPFSPTTPPQGVKAVDPVAASPAAAAALAAVSASHAAVAPTARPSAALECPQCGHHNAPGSRFCAACGFNLSSTSAPSVPAGVAAPPGVASESSLVLVALRADGSEAGRYDVPNEPKIVLGRDIGGIFSGDSYLSPRHASLTRQGNRVIVRDEGSLNGVYLKLMPHAPWPLNYGDVFRIGQEIIRLEPIEPLPQSPDGVERLGSPRDGYLGRLALVIGRDTTGNAFVIPATGVHCGRERGDILFSEDGYVSGLHCKIAPNANGQLELTDVGSSNGTFVRLSREHTLSSGDILLMGQQLFRLDFS